VCDALPPLPDFLPDSSTKRGTPGSRLSLWVQTGAPQQRSTQHSVKYYGTEEGKTKKKIQNGNRSQGEACVDQRRLGDRQLKQDGMEFDAATVGYVRMVTSLIEWRRVSEEEIVEMLVRMMRQHSIARRRRMDYVLAYLKKNAP